MIWKAALISAILVFALLPACENENLMRQEAVKRAAPNPFVAASSIASAADAGVPAAQTEPGKRSKIAFDQTEYNFGSVDAGENVEHVFTFKNVGESVLIVEKVQSS